MAILDHKLKAKEDINGDNNKLPNQQIFGKQTLFNYYIPFLQKTPGVM